MMSEDDFVAPGDCPPNGWTRKDGFRRIGSAGDLRIRYLAALGQGERTRVWVVGCFDTSGRLLEPSGAGSYRGELFALVWHMLRSDFRTMLARAKAFLGRKRRRIQ